jgi:hypothetical protein
MAVMHSVAIEVRTMKTYTYSTMSRKSLDKGIKYLVGDDIPFSFSTKKRKREEITWLDLKVKFYDEIEARRLWHKLNSIAGSPGFALLFLP